MEKLFLTTLQLISNIYPPRNNLKSIYEISTI
jgi:hypothetical protein